MNPNPLSSGIQIRLRRSRRLSALCLRGSWLGVGVLMLNLLVFGFIQVEATQIPAFSLKAIADRADRVVHGRVESVETIKGGDGRLRTRVEVVVDETWKGVSEPRVQVVQGSGVLGERWVRVVGEPEFCPGEEVVLFLVKTPAGEWVVAPLAQGKFSVTRDKDGARVGNGILGKEGTSPLGLSVLRDQIRTKTRTGGVE